MDKFDVLKLLKVKSYLTRDDIKISRISKETFQELCDDFNLEMQCIKINEEPYLIFTKNGIKLKDFSDINYDNNDGSIHLIIRFRNQEDLDVVSNKLFGNNLLSKKTIEVHMPSGSIKNKTKVTQKTSTSKTQSYFDNWKDMPEFITDFKESDYAKIDFYFDGYTIESLSKIFEQNITDKTKSIWYPKLIQGEHRNIRVLGGAQPSYPIYVVSKNRSSEYRFSTSNWLSRMLVNHYIVVEPSDYDNYIHCKLNESPYCHIIEMDMSYKTKYDCLNEEMGQKGVTGPGAARNFAADDARKNGFHWCWILDDNIENFDRYWRGHRILSHSPEIFSCVERFVNRYKNIGLAGLNYSKFCIGENVYPPYTLNTRIYSFGLWNLDCPYITQRGRYNEDTIQSLDVLTHGWCTVQFNCMLGAKVTTQKRQGGNTEEFYSKDKGGTLPKSQMLVEAYPQYAKLVWKFSRWHHEVDYSSFTQQLEYKDEYKYLENEKENIVNENGSWIVRIPKEDCLSDIDNRQYLEAHYPKGCKEDITNSNLYLE